MTTQSFHDTRRRERLDVGLYRRTTAAGDTRYDVAVWQGGRQQVRALPSGTSERRLGRRRYGREQPRPPALRRLPLPCASRTSHRNTSGTPRRERGSSAKVG